MSPEWQPEISNARTVILMLQGCLLMAAFAAVPLIVIGLVVWLLRRTLPVATAEVVAAGLALLFAAAIAASWVRRRRIRLATAELPLATGPWSDSWRPVALQRLQEARAVPFSVQNQIAHLIAVHQALQPQSPEALTDACEQLAQAHGSIGLQWRRALIEDRRQDSIEPVTSAFRHDAQPLIDEAARRVDAHNRSEVASGENGYVLTCAICSGDAATIRPKDNDAVLDYYVVVPRQHYTITDEPARNTMDLLAEGKLAKVIDYLVRSSHGCPVYCPDCGLLYCAKHYFTDEEWSGSWLTAVHAICPRGHSREVA